uniref:AB hydrolase-1 domain-containing protein n=1 Tax=Mycena chlorophos TaxID=658473 RepID=A0ABQ0LJ50_MYCCL|nr:predicted protein [Mycena chlorophos]
MTKTAVCSLRILLLVWFGAVQGSGCATSSSRLEDKLEGFAWNKLLSSDELSWTKCYENRECAKLKVPLDYANPEKASASIALIRVPAKVSPDSSAYRGPILINPGGPGVSGVDFVRGAYGDILALILGPDFDIVSFDPRGIRRSTPLASFFDTAAERDLWLPSIRKYSLNASANALASAWARGTILGQLAGERDYDGSLRFINTENTARDMLQIVKAHGREKLSYWGFSYGTVLGATFAAMFPDKIERMVIDGVVNSNSFYAGDWTDSLLDADTAWQSFAEDCVAAGPSRCAFYAPTTAEISSSIQAIYTRLRQRPIPVRGKTSYGLVDFSMLREVIFQAVYVPYIIFPQLATALASLADGDGTALFELHARYGFHPFECNCGDEDAEPPDELSQEGFWAVFCNDAERIPAGYNEMAKDYQGMLAVSDLADMIEPLRAGCVAWPDYPKTNFRGPFVANTSFPLLILGNTADPVTPLASAKKMSEGFSGSVVLTQDCVGHTTISIPSLCTHKHLRAYFQDGKLPEPGTICEVEAEVFPLPDSELDHRGSTQQVMRVPKARLAQLSSEDRQLVNRLSELATSVLDLMHPL